MEDLEMLIDNDNFYLVYYIILEKIRNLYSVINGMIDLPIMKIKKIYNDYEFARKYIISFTQKLPTQKFIDLYLEYLKINDKNIMFNNIKKLYDYSFGNLDFNPKKFCLRFENITPVIV